ncbi:MAG: TetR/AcrR family transcriptional regulator [Bacilli bacterium]
MSKIREPIKKSSIEKKNRIIEKGFELMCDKGYYNVNCIDIAKYAGVSTGIIYQYFENKKAIFLAGVRNYSDEIILPIVDILNLKDIKTNLKEIIEKIIDNFINSHKISKRAHEQLMAMSHMDDTVSNIFNDREIELTKKIVKLLEENQFNSDNLEEKVHICIGIIDNFCHEVVYHKHELLDYNNMKKEIIKTIEYLLTGGKD